MKHFKVFMALALVILLGVQCTAMAADTGWVEKKGAYHLYSNTGKQITGWYQEGNDWFYLQKKGLLVDGWVRMDTGIYHAGADGRIDEGWQKYKGVWYTLRKVNVGTEEAPVDAFRWFYVDGSEDMPFGTREFDGRKYDVTNKKAGFTGWTQYDGGKLYFNEDGTMDVGWRKLDGKIMYFDLAGRQVKGQRYISGAYYSFDSKGVIKEDKQTQAVMNASQEAPAQNAPSDNPAEAPANTGSNPANTSASAPSHNNEEDYDALWQALINQYMNEPQQPVSQPDAKPEPVHEQPASTSGNNKPAEQEQPASTSGNNKPVEQEQQPAAQPANETSAASTPSTPASTAEQPAQKPQTTTGNAADEYTYSYVTETVDIPFTTVYIDAPNWPKGEEAVVKEGKNGKKEITYQIKKDKNGKEVSRTVSSEKVTVKVVNKEIYRGTFVSEVTYTVVEVPDMQNLDKDKRSSELDAACTDWAMQMAQNNEVNHSDQGFGESVGGWGSMDEVMNGRDYTVISTHDGQTYNYNVSMESHGGELLAEGDSWGAGVVARTETQPDGSTVTTYFGCARSEEDENP